MDPRDVIADATLLNALGHMLAMSVLLRSEVGAFVVVREDRRLALLPWPAAEADSSTASYTGPLPAGLVALAHTHPPRSECPSPIDFELVEDLHVPVLVLSRNGVCVARVGASTPEWLLRDPNWTKRKRDGNRRQIAAVGTSP